MRTFLVLLSIPLLVLSHIIHEIGSSLSDGCRFILGERHFDLCPIINDRRHRLVQAELLDHANALEAVYSFTLADRHRSHGISSATSDSKVRADQDLSNV